jgi:hypothetical protein
MKEAPSFTITVKDFLCSHLHFNYDKETGKLIEGDHILKSAPVSRNVALSIFAVCENKHTAYIEWPTATSVFTVPILWDYSDWITEAARRLETLERSRKERIERFLLEANIKIAGPKIASFTGVSLEDACSMARKLILKKNLHLLKFYGVERLKEKENEL